MAATTDRLHELTHRVPGVPGHRPNPAPGASNAPHPHPGSGTPQHHAHPQREPRVLVRWQNWIASLGARLGR